jgi:polysaccharide deacetylase family protein (PEP-CTERM system associated)
VTPAAGLSASAPSELPSPSLAGSDGALATLNVLTFDVEDYFQVSAFDELVPRADWHTFESRVCRNTERLLEILEGADTRATFFVLGWVAERFPALMRQIRLGGHEIASHGYAHRLVYAGTPGEFRDDLRRARDVIQCAAGVPVVGYRAPSYSITRESLWALDILIEEGYEYDASIFPIRHDRYGIPDWPRHVHRVERSGGRIWEVPGSTVRWGGVNLPVGGGGYFRLLPYAWTCRGIARLNRVEGRPAVFYLHPWEIDPEQPRIPAGRLTAIRHYGNLQKTEHRLRRLLGDFRFGTVRELLNQPRRAD